MDYVIHILILISLYSTLAISLDLVVGHTGLLSLAQAAFYGLGAYVSALIALRLGMPFPVSLLAAMGAAALSSLAISLPASRLHDDYFVIAAFCFQMILFSVLNNWIEVTRGPLGISGIPQVEFLGWAVNSRGHFLIVAVGLAVLAHGVVGRITSSPFGRVLHAIREDDVLARAMGKNDLYFKAVAFGMSAALAASAGTLYACYVTYIDPSSFTVMESVLILAMVIIGGAGTRWGPLVGAAVLVVLPEALRFLGLPSIMAANLRQTIYGVLLVVVVMAWPRGLAGGYDFRR